MAIIIGYNDIDAFLIDFIICNYIESTYKYKLKLNYFNNENIIASMILNFIYIVYSLLIINLNNNNQNNIIFMDKIQYYKHQHEFSPISPISIVPIMLQYSTIWHS